MRNIRISFAQLQYLATHRQRQWLQLGWQFIKQGQPDVYRPPPQQQKDMMEETGFCVLFCSQYCS
jgi:hypothetical protein